MKLSTPPPHFVKAVTIPELARQIGVPRRTLFRKLLTTHTADRARGERHAHWLFRPARGPWAVNLHRLRAEHPEMFGVPTPEELHEQLLEVRNYGRDTRRQVNALAAAFRGHRAMHAAEPAD